MSKRGLIGTCVDSFDEEGDCVVSLPYATVTDFAAGDERAERMLEDAFRSKVIIPQDLEDLISVGHEIDYLWDQDKDQYMLYDADTDVHYFFGISI